MAKTLAQLIADTRQIIGQADAANSNFTDSQLTIWLNDAYRRAVTELRSFPQSSKDYNPTTKDVTLESGWLTIDVAKFDAQPADAFKELRIVSLEELINIDPDYENADTGIPEYFVRTSVTAAIIHPAPNTANLSATLRTWGLKIPTDLSGSSDTPSALTDNVHDALSHWAAFRAFQFMERPEASTQNLILYNQLIKSQKGVSAGASRGKSRWWFTEVD